MNNIASNAKTTVGAASFAKGASANKSDGAADNNQQGTYLSEINTNGAAVYKNSMPCYGPQTRTEYAPTQAPNIPFSPSEIKE